MTTFKHYTAQNKLDLMRVGFTNDQINDLEHIYQNTDIPYTSADEIVSLIETGTIPISTIIDFIENIEMDGYTYAERESIDSVSSVDTTQGGKRGIPLKYIPKRLSKKDKKRQRAMLRKSRKLYKQKKYYTRKPVKSFKSKTSKHIVKARKIYKLDKITPSKKLADKTGCSISSLEAIVKKGQGAYYSSGSRPNQTATSWGIARLASSITGGKSAAVDFKILDAGCKHTKKAYKLAKKARKKHKYGTRRVAKAV